MGFVVVGGGLAAATARSPSEHGTWAAAYLVLVAGVAQCALGLGQSWLVIEAPSQRLLVGELVTWNTGNVAVIGGTVLSSVMLTDAGGAMLLISLILFAAGTRIALGGWTALAYRLLIAMLAVSIPIGLLLERTSG